LPGFVLAGSASSGRLATALDAPLEIAELGDNHRELILLGESTGNLFDLNDQLLEFLGLKVHHVDQVLDNPIHALVISHCHTSVILKEGREGSP
jgi:hypothetical protein